MGTVDLYAIKASIACAQRCLGKIRDDRRYFRNFERSLGQKPPRRSARGIGIDIFHTAERDPLMLTATAHAHEPTAQS